MELGLKKKIIPTNQNINLGDYKSEPGEIRERGIRMDIIKKIKSLSFPKKEIVEIEEKPKKGIPIEPIVYPLAPVKPRRKIRKLPAYLKKTTRSGRAGW